MKNLSYFFQIEMIDILVNISRRELAKSQIKLNVITLIANFNLVAI